jgi:dipeptidyl aminopeptidase/acylaminoacyl peptidase
VYVVEVAEGAGDVVDARQVTSLPGSEAPEAWSESHGLIVSGTGHLLGTFNREMYRVPLDGGGGDPVSLTESLDENAIFVHIGREVLLVQALHRTGRALYAIELSSGALTRLTDERLYRQWFTASKDGSVVAYIADAWNEPTNVYAARVVEGGSGEARGVSSERRLTDVDSHVRGLLLGEQKVVRWASRADGEEIEGVLTLPVGYEEGSERVPLLLVIHGGPSGVSSDRYSPHRGAYPIQVFAGMGYAVLQPNYRGSTGYGERFRGLNRGDISGRDWIDIDSGVDAQIDAGLADPERLGIMGWSFGGHHTYWGITQTNRFRAASAGAGANDLISMYSQTDLPEFYHTYLGPKPWEDFELYEERSAYRFVERVVTPLLIQVGERDERVPAEQSVQFYEAAKAIGKAETQLVVYPGQPHGVREPRLFRDLLERNLDWFERLVPAGRSESRGSH